MMRLYLIGSLAAVTAGLLGIIWWQSGRIDGLKQDVSALKSELFSCGARINNLAEDSASDAEIDNLDDLRNIPDGWLRPDQPGTE